jgi:DNA repair protein RAD50
MHILTLLCFVQVSGRASIKGKLKLSFTSTSAKKIVAVKLFQLTQKANGKREYKQLDSVLKTTGSDGQEITISHKCSDMEKLVPNLLGVSKAILDLVIFCHQEESLWPMSDSKALKERFDDIFAATRYSAALSRIKKLRTEKAKELLEMQADVAVLQTNLEHVHKLRVR